VIFNYQHPHDIPCPRVRSRKSDGLPSQDCQAVGHSPDTESVSWL
jgi:hypothetical protein